MKFVVGADDEGEVLDAAVDALRAAGHEVELLAQDQWPDVAARVAGAVASGEADQGLLFCWTGTGTAMAANKVPGRARRARLGARGSPRARGAGTTRTCS